MTKDEALKLALEALLHVYHEDEAHPKTLQAITAIKEALANVATEDTSQERVDEIQKQRHEQEPVAWQMKPHQPPEEGEFIEVTARWGKRFVEIPDPIIGGNSLVRFYFDPPQRTWVGLTDEDWDKIFGNALTIGEAIKVTEAQLKQKNGYAEEKNNG